MALSMPAHTHPWLLEELVCGLERRPVDGGMYPDAHARCAEVACLARTGEGRDLLARAGAVQRQQRDLALLPPSTTSCEQLTQ